MVQMVKLPPPFLPPAGMSVSQWMLGSEALTRSQYPEVIRGSDYPRNFHTRRCQDCDTVSDTVEDACPICGSDFVARLAMQTPMLSRKCHACDSMSDHPKTCEICGEERRSQMIDIRQTKEIGRRSRQSSNIEHKLLIRRASKPNRTATRSPYPGKQLACSECRLEFPLTQKNCPLCGEAGTDCPPIPEGKLEWTTTPLKVRTPQGVREVLLPMLTIGSNCAGRLPGTNESLSGGTTDGFGPQPPADGTTRRAPGKDRALLTSTK